MRNGWNWSTWPCIIQFEASGSWEKVVLAIGIRKLKPRIISVDSCATKTHKVADEVRYDGLGHYPISCSVWKMCCLWEKLQKFMWEVQTKLTCQNMFSDFPWKVTIQWHYYHNMDHIYYLKIFRNYYQINNAYCWFPAWFSPVNFKLLRAICPNFLSFQKIELLNPIVYKSRPCQKYNFHIKFRLESSMQS